MGIARSQMRRQLYGIGNLVEREQYGIGSSLKKFVRKIIPNEISKAATTIAPFIAPFDPFSAAVMSSVGTFDQTGSISGSLKAGGLNYIGGQLARGIGGANLQALPGTEGFTGTSLLSPGSYSEATGGILGALDPRTKVGLTSPIGKGTEIGKFLSGKGTPGVDEIYSPEVPLKERIKNLGATDNLTNILKGDNIAENAFELLRKGGETLFYTDGKLDKQAVMAAIAGAQSYFEAKEKANDVGIDLTKQQWEEAKAKKRSEYDSKLSTFFTKRTTAANGGRMGFNEGSKPSYKDFEKFMKDREQYMKNEEKQRLLDQFEDYMNRQKPVEAANGGRIGYALGDIVRSDLFNVVEKGMTSNTPNISTGGSSGGMMGLLSKLIRENPQLRETLSPMNTEQVSTKKYIDFIDEDGDGIDDRVQVKKGGRIGYSTGSDKKPAIPADDFRKIIEEFMKNQEKQEKIRRENKAYGGRMKYKEAGIVSLTDDDSGVMYSDPSGKSISKEEAMKAFDQMAMQEAMEKNKIAPKSKPARLKTKGKLTGILKLAGAMEPEKGKEYFDSTVLTVMDEAGMKPDEINALINEIQNETIKEETRITQADGTGPTGMNPPPPPQGAMIPTPEQMEKMKREIFNVTNNPDILLKDDPIEVAQEYQALQQSGRLQAAQGGRMHYALGNEVMSLPVRDNGAGVKELDLRKSGGFIPPIGIKEKEDDIPAMLSNNEFVFTADAVGGADPEGKGNRERGAEQLYAYMKHLENKGTIA